MLPAPARTRRSASAVQRTTKGSRLSSARSTVKLSGVGNATVWASESLDATLSGAGVIEYYGDAKVTQKVSGLGVIKYLGAR